MSFSETEMGVFLDVDTGTNVDADTNQPNQGEADVDETNALDVFLDVDTGTDLNADTNPPNQGGADVETNALDAPFESIAGSLPTEHALPEVISVVEEKEQSTKASTSAEPKKSKMPSPAGVIDLLDSDDEESSDVATKMSTEKKRPLSATNAESSYAERKAHIPPWMQSSYRSNHNHGKPIPYPIAHPQMNQSHPRINMVGSGYHPIPNNAQTAAALHNMYQPSSQSRQGMFSQPNYLITTPGFVATWEQLIPAEVSPIDQMNNQANNRPRTFKLSLLSVTEFTITPMTSYDGYSFAGEIPSLRDLRPHIKKISRLHGKAVYEKLPEGGGRWRIPLGAYQAFSGYLCSDSLNRVELIPEEQLKVATLGRAKQQQSYPSPEELIQKGVPKGLANSLAPFQRGGVSFVEQRHGKALIADEMGLGKTVQGIASMTMWAEEWPLLVFSPSGARYHWKNEFINWLSVKSSINQDKDGGSERDEESLGKDVEQKAILKEKQIHVLTSSKDAVLPRKSTMVVICSYGLAPTLIKEGRIRPGDFQCVIVDESHMLKNKSTKRTSTILPILCAARRCVLLTGTPAFSRPIELWPQLTVLTSASVGFWRDEEEFVAKYVRNASAASLAELHMLLTSTVMIRRMKADILKSLPQKTRERVRLTVGDERMKRDFSNSLQLLRKGKGILALLANKLAQEEAKKDSAQQDQSSTSEHEPSTSVPLEMPVEMDANGEPKEVSRKAVLNHLYQLTGRAKVPTIVNMLKRWLDDPMKGKLCIFAHHIAVLDAITSGAGLSNRTDSKTKYIRIDGSTLPQARQDCINRFQNDPTVRIAILGITAAGVAVTLTASSTVWFSELFWTPSIMIQAEDRCHRIGQQSAVRCLYIVAKNTLDEVLWKLIEKKFMDLGQFVEGKMGHKIVVHRDFDDKEGVLFDLEAGVESSDDADDDEEKADSSKPIKREGSIENLADLASDSDLQHDIEELGMEEQAMIQEENNDEDESVAAEALPTPAKPVDAIGFSEESAICLSEDEEEPDKEEAVAQTSLRHVMPGTRIYKMYFSGPSYGLVMAAFSNRIIIKAKRAERMKEYGKNVKPDPGDIVVAVNGATVPYGSNFEAVMQLLKMAIKRPPVEVQFAECPPLKEKFKNIESTETKTPAAASQAASSQDADKEAGRITSEKSASDVIDLIDDD